MNDPDPNPMAPRTAPPPAAVTPEDSGSRALAEALRSSFAVVKLVMWVLVIVFLSSGFFTVGSQEKAVILRFGRPVGEGEKALLGAGLHWSLPYPIDDIVRIPITEIQQVTSTVGWYYLTPEQELSRVEPPAGQSLNPAVDGYLITADVNIIHSRVRLYYRIDDPVRYVFGFVNASYTIRNALDNALLSTAAHFGVDDILYRDKAGFKDEVQRRLTRLIAREQLGVAVDHCEVMDSIPPRQLKFAFDEVNTARENRTRVLNDAHTSENQILYQASAFTAAITNEAAADQARLVQSIYADAKRFNELLPKYELNPDLFAQVQLVEMLGTALTNVQEKIYLPARADGKPRELRLLLNREPPKPKTAAPTQP
jgi:modulator of FtsH protease HflK